MSYNKLHVSFVKLRDICDISSGQNAPQNSEDYCPQGFTFIKASDLESVINDDNENNTTKITKSAITKYKLKQFPEQSVVFAKSGLSCKKNRIYVTKKTTFVVNHLCVLSNFSSDFLPNWIALFLKEFNVTRLIKDDSYPSIKLSDIGNIDIPVIDKAEQGEKFSEIESICSTIRNKKKQILNFDSLVKSRFNEMFGDPMDEKKWNSKFTEVVIFNPKKSEVKKDMEIEASFVPMEAIGTDGSFSIKKSGKIKDFYKGYTYFKDGDVIFAKITPCFENGKIAIANHCTNKIGFGTTEFHVARPISGKTNAEWVMNLLRNDSLHTYASSKMTGSAGQKRIQTPFFEKLGVYLPPLELQNRFADFVHLVDKSRFVD